MKALGLNIWSQNLPPPPPTEEVFVPSEVMVDSVQKEVVSRTNGAQETEF